MAIIREAVATTREAVAAAIVTASVRGDAGGGVSPKHENAFGQSNSPPP